MNLAFSIPYGEGGDIVEKVVENQENYIKMCKDTLEKRLMGLIPWPWTYAGKIILGQGPHAESSPTTMLVFLILDYFSDFEKPFLLSF